MEPPNVKFKLTEPQIISSKTEVSQPPTQQTRISATITNDELTKPQRTPKSGGLTRQNSKSKNVGLLNNKELAQKDNNILNAQKLGNAVNNNSALKPDEMPESKEKISAGKEKRLERLKTELSYADSATVSKRTSADKEVSTQTASRIKELQGKESLTKTEVEELRGLSNIQKKDKTGEYVNLVLSSADQLMDENRIVSDENKYDTTLHHQGSKDCWKAVSLIYNKQEALTEEYKNQPESKEFQDKMFQLEEMAHKLEKAADNLETKAKDMEYEGKLEGIRSKQTLTSENKKDNNQSSNIHNPYTYMISDRVFSDLKEFHQLEVILNEAKELAKHYKTIKDDDVPKLNRFRNNFKDFESQLKACTPYEQSSNKEERDVISAEINKYVNIIVEKREKRSAAADKRSAKGKI